MLTSKLVSGDHQNTIVIGTMAYQAWGLRKATDLAEHNRTWTTMYKYVSKGTGQESTSVCGRGGGRGDEKFLNAIISIHECEYSKLDYKHKDTCIMEDIDKLD